jgi:hypothetical protein
LFTTGYKRLLKVDQRFFDGILIGWLWPVCEVAVTLLLLGLKLGLSYVTD